MARLHQRFDLVLCPVVPDPPPLAEAATSDPVQALWTQLGAVDLLLNLTRQPAISVPMGFAQNGLPRAVQFAAAQYRDDIALRAARAIESVQPFPTPDLG